MFNRLQAKLEKIFSNLERKYVKYENIKYMYNPKGFNKRVIRIPERSEKTKEKRH